jgi:hypothetical protein
MPKMPVKWTDFQYASQVINNVFDFFPMSANDNYSDICTANWLVKPTGYAVGAINGTTVGLNLNKVFDPKYIDPVGGSFAYTPDDSYNTASGLGYAEALLLPNTFKMYIENAAWNAGKNKWETDEYDFGYIANNRYNLVRSSDDANYVANDDDEFSLISHTLAADAKKYATKITYTYNGVSTRIENGKWVVAGNYEVTDAPYQFDTRFVDPFAKPTQSTEKDGSNTYSFSTTYKVAPAKDIELKFFKLTGQYLKTAPYVDTLDKMLAGGYWKIAGEPTIVADNGLIYYRITNLATIATDGKVKIANFPTHDESGRPNAKVTQKLTIPLVNILGGKYDFTFSFDMARE